MTLGGHRRYYRKEVDGLLYGSFKAPDSIV
jgi:hypothetical protein